MMLKTIADFLFGDTAEGFKPARPSVVDEHHFHACGECGNIWDHDPLENGTLAEFEAGHTCNNCGSKTNCDLAFLDQHEAAEFATHDYVTVKGQRYYA